MINDLDLKDRDIAMVFQNDALYPTKTVNEDLAFPLRMKKVPKADIDTRVRQTAEVLSITTRDVLNLAFDSERIHLFDSSTELAIRPAATSSPPEVVAQGV